MHWQDCAQDFDETVGSLYGINASERRCLAAIWSEPQTSGKIAETTGLTKAAITALVDRLQARGFVERQTDPTDRRKVLIAQSPKSRQLIADTYMKLSAAGNVMLEGFSDAELTAVVRYLALACELTETTRKELRNPSGIPVHSISRQI